MRAQTLNYRKLFPSPYFDLAPPYICWPERITEVLTKTLQPSPNYCFDCVVSRFSATPCLAMLDISKHLSMQTQQYNVHI